MGALPEILLPFAQDPDHSALCLDFDGTLAAICLLYTSRCV